MSSVLVILESTNIRIVDSKIPKILQNYLTVYPSNRTIFAFLTALKPAAYSQCDIRTDYSIRILNVTSCCIDYLLPSGAHDSHSQSATISLEILTHTIGKVRERLADRNRATVPKGVT